MGIGIGAPGYGDPPPRRDRSGKRQAGRLPASAGAGIDVEEAAAVVLYPADPA
jgi:hypothetical protein